MKQLRWLYAQTFFTLRIALVFGYNFSFMVGQISFIYRLFKMSHKITQILLVY